MYLRWGRRPRPASRRFTCRRYGWYKDGSFV